MTYLINIKVEFKPPEINEEKATPDLGRLNVKIGCKKVIYSIDSSKMCSWNHV